jgi:hypothetical protein
MHPIHNIPEFINAHDFLGDGGAVGALLRNEARLLSNSTKANRSTFAWAAEFWWNLQSLDWLLESSTVTMPRQEASIVLMRSLKFTI